MVDDRIRTSDADRERVTARLRDHYAEGRLTHEELDERISAALNAKTFGDLRRVLADLPEPGPLAPPLSYPAGRPFRPYPVVWRGPRLLPLMALVLLAFVLIPGASAAAVLFKVLAITAAFMFAFLAVGALLATRFIRRARRHWYFEQLRNGQAGDGQAGDWQAGDWQAWNWPHGHGHGPGHDHQARSWRG